jgi:hypothetical protein
VDDGAVDDRGADDEDAEAGADGEEAGDGDVLVGAVEEGVLPEAVSLL